MRCAYKKITRHVKQRAGQLYLTFGGFSASNTLRESYTCFLSTSRIFSYFFTAKIRFEETPSKGPVRLQKGAPTLTINVP